MMDREPISRLLVAIVRLALAGDLVVRAVRPGRFREWVRGALRVAYHSALRAIPAKSRPRASATPRAVRLRAGLEGRGFDADAVAWAGAVLAGIERPAVSDDPESAHDLLRLRGVLPLLSEYFVATGSEQVRERIHSLLDETRVRMEARPSIAWDTTTAALRVVSLLRANETLSSVDPHPFSSHEWMAGFLRAHSAVLAAGRVVEGRGNHQVINVVGRCAVELLASRAQVSERLAAELHETLRSQFLPDGGHIERSPHYHLQMLVLTELVLRADADRGGRLSARVAAPVDAARAALASLTGPDGELLRFGDSSRPFTGEVSSHSIRALAPHTPATPGVRLDDFGIQWLSNDAGRHAWHVAMDCGPLGLDENPGHGHADALSFVLHVDGRPCFVDPGTYRYQNSSEARWFKLPEAHNTIHWSRHPSHELGKFFRWTRHPGAPVRRDAGVGRVDAEQDWNVRGRGYRHRRTCLLAPDRFVIEDRVETRQADQAIVRMILHPEVRARRTQRGRSVLLDVGGTVLEVDAGADAPPVEILNCRYAPEYGSVQATSGLQWVLPVAAGPRTFRVVCVLAQ